MLYVFIFIKQIIILNVQIEKFYAWNIIKNIY